MPPPEPTKPPAYVMAQYALSGPHTPTGYGNISPSASFLFAAANSSPVRFYYLIYKLLLYCIVLY
jgi:hypothetical protein